MLPPTYQTERFVVKPYQQENENRFVEMAIDAQSVKFMGGASGDKVIEKAVFQKIFSLYQSQKERWFWVWGIYDNNRLCGHLELKESEYTKPNELEIVYMIHPSERRRGVMSEVLDFLKIQQTNWQKRIIATVSLDNQPSINLLMKWGIDRQEILENEVDGERYYKLMLSL